MRMHRRTFLKSLSALSGTMLAAGAGLLRPLTAWAAEWNKAAFEARTLAEAMKGAGVATAADSKDISIKAPDIAENGAVVPVEIACKIPDTRRILIFAEKNPQPMVANFMLAPGVEPYISTRIKMGETSNIKIVAITGDNKMFTATKEVKVTIGGCG
jgi:sulfur-oxidizing protein SoxY